MGCGFSAFCKKPKRGDSPPLDAPIRRNATTPKPSHLPLSESPHDDQPRPLQANIDLPAIDEESPIDGPSQLPVFLTVTKRRTPDVSHDLPQIDNVKRLDDDVSQSERSRENSIFVPTYKDGCQEDEQYNEISEMKEKEELDQQTKQPEKEEVDLFNEQDQLAATKIQASYRGFRTRRALATGAAVAGAVGIGFFPYKNETEKTTSTSTLAVVPDLPASDSPTVSLKGSSRDSPEPRSVNGYFLLKEGVEESPSDLNLPESNAYEVSEPDEGQNQAVEELISVEPGDDTDPLLHDESDEEATESPCGNLIDFGVEDEEVNAEGEEAVKNDEGEVLPTDFGVEEEEVNVESEEFVKMNEEGGLAIEPLNESKIESLVLKEENCPGDEQKGIDLQEKQAEPSESSEIEEAAATDLQESKNDDEAGLGTDHVGDMKEDVGGDLIEEQENRLNETEKNENDDINSVEMDLELVQVDTATAAETEQINLSTAADESEKIYGAVVELVNGSLDVQQGEEEANLVDTAVEETTELRDSSRSECLETGLEPCELIAINEVETTEENDAQICDEKEPNDVHVPSEEEVPPAQDEASKVAVPYYLSRDSSIELYEVDSTSLEKSVVEPSSMPESLTWVAQQSEQAVVPGYDSQFLNAVSTHKSFDGMGETLEETEDIIADELERKDDEFRIAAVDSVLENPETKLLAVENTEDDGTAAEANRIETDRAKIEKENDREVEIIIQRSMDLDDEIASVILSALSEENSQRSSRAVSKEPSFAAVDEIEDAAEQDEHDLVPPEAIGNEELPAAHQVEDVTANELHFDVVEADMSVEPVQEEADEHDVTYTEKQPEVERLQVCDIRDDRPENNFRREQSAEEEEVIRDDSVNEPVSEDVHNKEPMEVIPQNDDSYGEQPKSNETIDLLPCTYKESSNANTSDSSLATTTEGVACDRSLAEVEISDVNPSMDRKSSEDQVVAVILLEDFRRLSSELVVDKTEEDIQVHRDDLLENKELDTSTFSVENPIGITITADDLDEDNYIWRKLQGAVSVDEDDLYVKAATKIQATYRGYCTRRHFRDTTPETQVTELSDDDRQKDILNEIETASDLIIEDNEKCEQETEVLEAIEVKEIEERVELGRTELISVSDEFLAPTGVHDLSDNPLAVSCEFAAPSVVREDTDLPLENELRDSTEKPDAAVCDDSEKCGQETEVLEMDKTNDVKEIEETAEVELGRTELISVSDELLAPSGVHGLSDNPVAVSCEFAASSVCENTDLLLEDELGDSSENPDAAVCEFVASSLENTDSPIEDKFTDEPAVSCELVTPVLGSTDSPPKEELRDSEVSHSSPEEELRDSEGSHSPLERELRDLEKPTAASDASAPSAIPTYLEFNEELTRASDGEDEKTDLNNSNRASDESNLIRTDPSFEGTLPNKPVAVSCEPAALSAECGSTDSLEDELTNSSGKPVAACDFAVILGSVDRFEAESADPMVASSAVHGITDPTSEDEAKEHFEGSTAASCNFVAPSAVLENPDSAAEGEMRNLSEEPIAVSCEVVTPSVVMESTEEDVLANASEKPIAVSCDFAGPTVIPTDFKFDGELTFVSFNESEDQKIDLDSNDRGSDGSNLSVQTVLPGEAVKHTSEESEVFLEDRSEFDVAATKIQAVFRGYQVRKNTAESSAGQLDLLETQQLEEQVGTRTKLPEEVQSEIAESDDNGEGLQDVEEAAATKIQAAFRGYQVRKNTELSVSVVEKVAVENEKPEDLKDEGIAESAVCEGDFFVEEPTEVEDAAATKIQAVFRGHQVRKNMVDIQSAPVELEAEKQEELEDERASPDGNMDFQEEKEAHDVSGTEDLAAVKIQAVFRGYQVRKNLVENSVGVESRNIPDVPEVEEYHTEPIYCTGSEADEENRLLIDALNDEAENAAATKVQAAYRGYQVRKNLVNLQFDPSEVELQRSKDDDQRTDQEQVIVEEDLDDDLNPAEISRDAMDDEMQLPKTDNADTEAAACILQSAFRDYRMRKQKLEEQEKETRAAVTIQSVFRGYQARKASPGPTAQKIEEKKNGDIPLILMESGDCGVQEIVDDSHSVIRVITDSDIPELADDFLLCTNDRSREGSNSSVSTSELSEDDAARRIQGAYRTMKLLRSSKEPSPDRVDGGDAEELSEEDAARRIQEKFRALRIRRKVTPNREIKPSDNPDQQPTVVLEAESASLAILDAEQAITTTVQLESPSVMESALEDVNVQEPQKTEQKLPDLEKNSLKLSKQLSSQENENRPEEESNAEAEIPVKETEKFIQATTQEPKSDDLNSAGPESFIPDSLETPVIRRDSGTPIDSLELVPPHMLLDLAPFAHNFNAEFEPDSLSAVEKIQTDSLEINRIQEQEKILEEESFPVDSLISDLSESELRPSEISDFLRDIDADRFPAESNVQDESSSMSPNKQLQENEAKDPNLVLEEGLRPTEDPVLPVTFVDETKIEDSDKAEVDSDISEGMFVKEVSEIAENITKAIEEAEFIAHSHESPVYKKPDPQEIARFNESMEEFEIDEIDALGDTDHSSDWSDGDRNLEEVSEDILNHAATRIQAQYRGYRTRQRLKRQKYLQNHNHQKQPTSRDDSLSTTASTDLRVPDLHGFGGCDELHFAATKIQAGVRGFLVRRAMRKLREARRNFGAGEGIYACVRRGSRRHSDILMRQPSDPPLKEWSCSDFTRQLDSMHEVVAATIIQAYFRGYRARKRLGRSSRKVKSMDQLSYFPSNTESLAATKIQAAFRGYKTRKSLKLNPKTSRPHSALSNISGDDDSDKERAAMKIQANFRGYRVRRDLRKKPSEDLSCH